MRAFMSVIFLTGAVCRPGILRPSLYIPGGELPVRHFKCDIEAMDLEVNLFSSHVSTSLKVKSGVRVHDFPAFMFLSVRRLGGWAYFSKCLKIWYKSGTNM